LAGLRHEANAVAHSQQGRRYGSRIEQAQPRASDQPPASRRGQRIDTGLRAADGHTALGHMFARRGKARRSQFLGKPAEIRKARGESHEIDFVDDAGEALDYGFGRQAGVACNFFQIGPALAAEFHCNFDLPRLGIRRRGSIQTSMYQRLDALVGVAARIEIDEHGSVRRVEIQNLAGARKAVRQPGHRGVGFGADAVAKHHVKRAVAGRPDGHTAV